MRPTTTHTTAPKSDALGIEVAGVALVCLAERMLLWPAERTLFVADVHLGKAASFRAAGVPLPSGHSNRDLARISALLARHQATRLVILGDLIHTRSSYTEALHSNFRAFRAAHHSVAMILVRGNHDRHAGDAPPDWDLRVVSEPFALGPFACCHESGNASAGIELAGHLHPALRLQARGEGITLPCFWLHARGIVLPAFGSLTGNATVSLTRGERAVVIAGQQLHAIDFRE
jgi:uncharacterized protein